MGVHAACGNSKSLDIAAEPILHVFPLGHRRATLQEIRADSLEMKGFGPEHHFPAPATRQDC